MISWTKTLEMKVNSFFKKDYGKKGTRARETKVRFLNSYGGSFSVPIEIEIDNDTILVFDAEYLKQACEKCIAIKAI